MTVIIVFIGWMYYNNYHFVTEYYKVVSKKLPKSFHGSKLILITDFHNQSFGKNNERLLEAIEKENPDYIMIAGDMLIKGKKFEIETAIELLKRLSEKYPVYYAPGNHEHQLGKLEQTKECFWNSYIARIKRFGVKYLVNETVILQKGTERIKVSGIDIDSIYYKKGCHRPKLQKEEMHKDMRVESASCLYQILLAHNPEYFETYAEWGADLVLAGHVHGGIMILPFLGGVVAPSYQIFPKYDFGKFVYRNSIMVLSRGLAVHSIKIRIFNVPELSVITLEKE